MSRTIKCVMLGEDADGYGLAELERNDQVAFRYSTRKGHAPNGSDANPNGSVGDIAGVYNREKNVLGMMPHPERLFEKPLGGTDGRRVFESALVAAMDAAASICVYTNNEIVVEEMGE